MSTESFIAAVKQGALNSWTKYKVLPSVITAQAILESGWGKSELAAKGNNLFGVKASNWLGETVIINTKEFVNELWTTVDAHFRKYSSWSESIEDHALFLTKERYKAAIGETDYKKAIQAIHSAGYATDPTYSDKVISIIEKYKLYELDKGCGDLKIVLDAGHALVTAGKQTPCGMKEFEFNNAVANECKSLLEQYEGIEVLFVHDVSGKIDVPLPTRAKKANDWKADCYISIHANAAGSGWSDANGIETYVYTTKPKEALTLATAIQNQLIKETGLRNRGVKSANFQVLRETNMTAILAECGFMTNKNEAALLKSDDFRKKCSKAIVEGIAEQYKLKKIVKAASAINEIIKGVEKEMEQPLFKPSSNTFKNEMVTYLENAHKKGIISSRVWIEKAKSGTLAIDDAIALIVTINNRNQ